MEQSNTTGYLMCMKQVRQRFEIIESYLDSSSSLTSSVPEYARIELACLQLRKCLELIAFASMISYEKEYKKVYDNFSKTWNAKFLLNDLHKLNNDFYPKPVKIVRCNEDPRKTYIVDINDGYLTREEFCNVYDKCGGMLHSRNPSKGTVDYNFYREAIPLWVTKISRLLSNHLIRIMKGKEFYLVSMVSGPHGDLNCVKCDAMSDDEKKSLGI